MGALSLHINQEIIVASIEALQIRQGDARLAVTFAHAVDAVVAYLDSKNVRSWHHDRRRCEKMGECEGILISQRTRKQ